jgi:NADPH:quinone reductase-like Zn-dependent oxidoreductase
LIHGAAGGVSMAVQLAKAKGATVIGTATGEKTAFVAGLGADRVIDYKAERFDDVVSSVDLVLDVIGGETLARSWRTIRDGGALVRTVPPLASPPAEAAARDIVGKTLAELPDCNHRLEIARLVDAGQVKTVVGQVFALADARRAQELGESGGFKGKAVISIG